MKRGLFILFIFYATIAVAQPEKSQVRSGNKLFSKGDIEKAELEYRRALENNPNSVFGKYNLGNALYKRGNSQEAQKVVSSMVDSLDNLPIESKVFHNLGNYALDLKEYSQAVEFYKNSLRVNPSDMETKSNLAFAQAMLKNEEDKDNNKENDKENQDNKDDNKENQDNKDDNKDNQDKKDDNKDNQDNKDDNKENQENQPPPKITPQTAQQMLQAIQNKEKETQEKVSKEKAKVMESKQKEKNW